MSERLREAAQDARRKLERYLGWILPTLHPNDYKPELNALLEAVRADARATAVPEGPWRALPDTDDNPDPWWVNNRETARTLCEPFTYAEAIAVRDALNGIHTEEGTDG